MRNALALLILLLAPAAVAAATFTSSDERVGSLEELHSQADRLIVAEDYRGVVKVYQEILLVEPDDEVAYTNMGHAFMLLGDYPAAANAFKNALHINPENEVARAGLVKIQDPDVDLGALFPSSSE